MISPKVSNLLLPALGLSVLVITVLFLNNQNTQPTREVATIVSATPTPFEPFPYKRPRITKKRSYVTFLAGDSMVKALGVNANQLRLNLIEHYPENEFVNYNYGFAATNILSLPLRVNEQTVDAGTNFPPIIGEYFDLIIIESFAYNPLSHLSIEEGLKQQTAILDTIVRQVISAHPNAVVAIMATIAPSKEFFAQGVLDLSSEEREKWANERILYLDNAIAFANERNLPLINIYEESQLESGDANLDFINASDFIHPSEAGVQLISKTIADFIYENEIFPR